MRPKAKHKRLFDELDEVSRLKDFYSLNEFLGDRGVTMDEFEEIANTNKRFMQFWDNAEDQAWENIKTALFTKSLPRSRIAEYIQEGEAFQGKDPEDIMTNIETGQAKLELYLTAMGDEESLAKYGRLPRMSQSDALLKCCLNLGLLDQETYNTLIAMPDDDEM